MYRREQANQPTVGEVINGERSYELQRVAVDVAGKVSV